MSTKIYDAYEFNGSMEELLQFCKELKLKWIEFFLKERIEKTFGLDGKNTKITIEQYNEVIGFVEEETKKKYNMTGDVFDFKASVLIYPFENRLFVQFFLDIMFLREEVEVLLKQDGRFTDYHYQNQSDPWFDYEKFSEEEVKQHEKDWNERKRVWDRIFEEFVEYDEENPVAILANGMNSFGFVYELGSDSNLSMLLAVINAKYKKMVQVQ